ncbi:hypothetical protein ACQKP0_22890 [Heyndrickxia sp. NPDC080065]|uniref:hypothetical protein n=1 Tax=Heyndrickxia sp. NPDC080065 TaxID=3390568 RepID=UPI003D081448
MKNLITLIISSSLLFILTIPALAEQLEYPANQGKSFTSEDKFYKQLKKEYREFEDATYSIRRKISYKETPDALMTFEEKTGRYFGQPKQKLAPNIHPERQVYFLASFIQSRDKEYLKFEIIDAETKQSLARGNSSHSYINPYK